MIIILTHLDILRDSVGFGYSREILSWAVNVSFHREVASRSAQAFV